MIKLHPLAAVAVVNPSANGATGLPKATPVSFLPMSSISGDGCVLAEQERPIGEVFKGYTAFRKGDILVAKITPCMENGKAAHLDELNHEYGYGSTEFHVVRPGPNIDGRYLFYMLWNPIFRQQAEMNMTGSAGQKRVPTSFVERFSIPVPETKSEQRRIADILDEARGLRQKRADAIRLASDLVPSQFYAMFGDVVQNDRGWQVSTLQKVAQLDRGRSRHRPRNAPHLYGGPYPFVQTGDVSNANGWIESFSQTYSELGLAQSKLWPKGTLCITIAANIAATAVLTFDACFPDSIVGLVPGPLLTTNYVRQWFVHMQRWLEERAPQVAQKNINLEILNSLEIPLPPKILLTKFEDFIAEWRTTRGRQAESQQELNHLFHSLLQRAFRGEL